MIIYSTQLLFACGCNWTEEYPNGSTKTEVNKAKKRTSMELCPKCGELLRLAKRLKELNVIVPCSNGTYKLWCGDDDK